MNGKRQDVGVGGHAGVAAPFRARAVLARSGQRGNEHAPGGFRAHDATERLDGCDRHACRCFVAGGPRNVLLQRRNRRGRPLPPSVEHHLFDPDTGAEQCDGVGMVRAIDREVRRFETPR